jgi:filamentous hemagglutinin
MRLMGGSFDGGRESGAAATLIGQMPSDSGAQWQYAGKTDDGKPILTQLMPQANAELQNYIVANAGSVPAGDVPSIIYDQNGKKEFGVDVTGPFTKFDKSDADYMRSSVAESASMISTNAGRFSAATAALAQIPSPYSPALSSASFAGTVTGIIADAVGQLVKPNDAQYVFNGFTAIISDYASGKWPLWSPAINEVTNKVNDSETATSLQERVKGVIKK